MAPRHANSSAAWLIARIDKSLLTKLGKAVALAMALYHLYEGFYGSQNALVLRSAHLGFALVVTFLMVDWRERRDQVPSLLDALLVVCAIGVAAYPIIEIHYIYTRLYLIDPITVSDWIFGVLAIALIVEATRRLMGWPLAITAGAFVLYGLVFTDIAPSELIEQSYLTTQGIFGIPLAVSATYIVLFVIFGALIEKMGIGQFFTDLALALAGRSVGGSAKVAVITSSLFGTVSGNGVANVMTTGIFTIPMMKKSGFAPEVAGAVEAVASTGGQILPPIMGASAFIMAEFIGVSYATILLYALIPAILYYVSVFFAIHAIARRDGMASAAQQNVPNLGIVLKGRGHMALPLVALVAALGLGYSAQFSALIGIATVIPVALLRRSTRANVTFRKVLEALILGAKNASLIAIACACAGIVVGIISITGIGLDFSHAVLSLAQHNLYLALVLASIAGIIVGMGIPTAPAYIVQVALFVPTLTDLNIPIPAAHMFAFYFAILSGLTPPVAITVYATNSMTGARLWPGCVAAMKLAGTAYVMPFMFALSPALITIGSGPQIVVTVLTALAGSIVLTGGLQGWLLIRLGWQTRVLAIASGLALLGPSILLDLLGAVLVLPVILLALREKNLSKVEKAQRPS